MAGPAVEVEGLAEFRRQLKAVDKAWTKELTKAHRALGVQVRDWSRAEARSMGGPFAKFAGKINAGGRATGAWAGIQPVANAVFWGAKKHTGWYSRPRFFDSSAQHPPWVGNSWDVGGTDGPYAINRTIRNRSDEIVERFGVLIDQICRDAFPHS